MEPIISSVSSSEFSSIFVRTTVIFLYAFFLLRLLGRRRLSHLSYTDLLLIISFGSAVGDVMIYDESIVHFWSSVSAITIVAIIVKILDEFSSRSSIGSKILEGDAAIFIDNGKLVKAVLDREDITESKIESWLRQKNIDSIDKVEKAFIETDGEVSFILKK